MSMDAETIKQVMNTTKEVVDTAEKIQQVQKTIKPVGNSETEVNNTENITVEGPKIINEIKTPIPNNAASQAPPIDIKAVEENIEKKVDAEHNIEEDKTKASSIESRLHSTGRLRLIFLTVLCILQDIYNFGCYVF